jgi:hypothetical protein
MLDLCGLFEDIKLSQPFQYGTAVTDLADLHREKKCL